MIKLRGKKENLKFVVKNRSTKGIISFGIGCFSVIAFLTISFVSSLADGNSGLFIGGIGILLFILSVIGVVVGIQSCKEKEIYYTAPVVGIVMNGIFSIIYFILYLLGLI